MDKNKDKVLMYETPHPSGGVCRTQLTREQAIKFTRELHPNLKWNDEEVLLDFIVIHWAWWVEPWEKEKSN